MYFSMLLPSQEKILEYNYKHVHTHLNLFKIFQYSTFVYLLVLLLKSSQTFGHISVPAVQNRSF